MKRARAIAAANKHRNLGPILIEVADIRCASGDRASALRLLQTARPLIAQTYADEPWRMAWLDLVTAQCRKVAVEAATRAIILKRWTPSSHFGRRAALS